MKTKILLIIISLLGCISAHAIPVKPGVKYTITLADGQQIETTLCGDEFYRYYVADDGSVYQQKGKQFERISLEEAQNEWKSSMARAREMYKMTTRSDARPNVTGKRKALVILMQFQDVKFSQDNPQAEFNDYFNKENYNGYGMAGSVKKYFKEQSYGQFELDFDVVGPFTAPENSAYYGENIDGNFVGRIPELVFQSYLMADSLVNYADYDWNDDKVVDQVYMIFAGYDEAQGAGPDAIYSHSYNVSKRGFTLDGVSFYNYACSSELFGTSGHDLAGIGSVCHEFSHCLGLKDMYNTKTGRGYGMITWDLMDTGCYNNNGRTPAGYTSFERSYMGWLTPKELTSKLKHITDMKPLADTPEAYIISNGAYKQEYYMLENRQLKGFDSALDGHGLLVLHIDNDNLAWLYNEYNSDPNHQRCTVIAADNEWSYSKEGVSGDAYPGPTNNTSLSNVSTPAATLFHENTDGQMLMNKSIDGITESEDGLISFWFYPRSLISLNPSDIHGIPLPQASSQNIYNLQGRQMGTNLNNLPPGIYIINGQKVVK